ncbi:hypothetical protein [Filimonas effusa]|uniref:Uncharacterized protein n=1 Tax=Filimonas effusa TaxID=2508721 RepID=A0A4Q1D6C8_9BACT|nr:hypothetical protein [Filimonas effusa]RXK83261.1 hypothetical protein ESB13_14205 [Filimonas effusa]
MKVTILIACMLWAGNIYAQHAKQTKDETISQPAVEAPSKYVITRNIDTAIGKIYPNAYKKQDSVVGFYQTYFVNDLVKPGDINHPVYQSFMKKAEVQAPEVKAKIAESLKKEKGVKRSMLGTLEYLTDVSDYTFQAIPVYYIVPNIVMYDTGVNAAEYYNLDTSKVLYVVLKGRQLVGTALKSPVSGYRLLDTSVSDSVAYGAIAAMGKQPVGFQQRIALDPAGVGGARDIFGYVKSGHLFFYYYEEYPGARETNGKVDYSSVNVNHTLLPAEAYFAGNSNICVLQGLIDSHYNAQKRLRK